MVSKLWCYFSLRDWDLLAALLPPDSFTFSSFFFFFLVNTGYKLSMANSLKIKVWGTLWVENLQKSYPFPVGIILLLCTM